MDDRQQFIAAIERRDNLITELKSQLAELQQHVCDECSPDDYGWNYNAVEGRVPCACIVESGAYQELEAQLEQARELPRHTLPVVVDKDTPTERVIIKTMVFVDELEAIIGSDDDGN